MSNITIVFPAYNEEKRISKSIEHYVEFFSKYQHQIKILIIPNGCKDKTADIAREWQKKYPSMIDVYEVKEAIGKGGAITKGFELAEGDYIGFVDVDEATKASEYAKVIEAAFQADGAIAARWRKDSVIYGRNSILRKLASEIFSILNRIFLGLKYSDTQCGAKVFKKQAIKDVLPHLTIKDMAIDIQLLYVLKKKGYKIVEIPTVWTEVAGSAMLGTTSKFIKQSWSMFKNIFKIKFQKI